MKKHHDDDNENINYVRKGSYNVDRLNTLLDVCKSSTRPVCDGWMDIEILNRNRLPSSGFGISSSPSLLVDDDKRICCLYHEMKTKFDSNINSNRIPFLHSRTISYLDDLSEFTLSGVTGIAPDSLRDTNRHWGLMSGIYAYIIRNNRETALIYVPNNGRIGCFSTLFMIEINMLRYPIRNEKMNKEERRIFNKKVEKYNEKLKKEKNIEKKIQLTRTNPEIKSFPIEIRQVKQNKKFVSEDNNFDITLKNQFYDAENLYQECNEIRGNNEMTDNEYRK